MTERGFVEVALDVTAIPAQPVGAGRYVVELARALAARGDNRPLLIARRDDEQRWESVSGLSRTTAVAPSSRPARLLWEQTTLPGLLSSLGPDLHHGPHYTLPARAKLPKVVTIHDMTFFDHPEWHERMKVRFFRRAIRHAVRDATAIIAVSEDTARRLQERFGPLPVTAIPHGVDHARFHPVSDGDAVAAERALLEQHGIAGDYLAFVGTLEPRKDVPALIAAFDRLAETHPSLRLVVAGRTGWGTKAIESAFREARHADRIVRPGYLPDPAIPALLRGARAVAYPSLVEGFGLPALEALACGAVLVTTTGSAMDEVVDDAALLIPPGDVDALTDRLRVALTDDSLAQRLRTRGPQVAARYTWAASAEAHLRVYRSVRNAR